MHWKSTLVAAILAAALPKTVVAQTPTVPNVPSNLEVPAGHQMSSMARAEGTQNYICLLSPSKAGIAWTFIGPQATLFGADDEQVMTHFLSPNPAENGTPRATWQHSGDTSAAWAGAVASSTDPAFVAENAIPWLLLRVVGTKYGPQSGDTLVGTTYIQRVNTAGGVAPAEGCHSSKDIGKRTMVPYTTDYVFYR